MDLTATDWAWPAFRISVPLATSLDDHQDVSRQLTEGMEEAGDSLAWPTATMSVLTSFERTLHLDNSRSHAGYQQVLNSRRAPLIHVGDLKAVTDWSTTSRSSSSCGRVSDAPAGDIAVVGSPC